jgi:hypothetical protein
MITNAEQHQQMQGKGRWRSAQKLRICSHYFGNIAACRKAIIPGQKYFDTEEIVPDAGMTRGFIVCGNCANTPHRADFLAERSLEVKQCAHFPCSELCRARGCHYVRIGEPA